MLPPPLALVALLVACAVAGGAASDAPCAARAVPGAESILCVCNSTYCDEVPREPPSPGRYIQYTSTKSGQRFNVSSGAVTPASGGVSLVDSLLAGVRARATLEVDIGTSYQSVEGFGGAVTDSAGIDWRALPSAAQSNLIRSYFGGSGSGYNMLRVPIGGSDFSTRPYAYNETPENDTALTNFTLAAEDHLYKIPMIKAAMAAAGEEVRVVASTWSPPPWMKTNRKFSGKSRLEHEYYQTYADYHLKFLQRYAAQGVRVWAITTTNEPVNGVVPYAQFNSLGWTPAAQARWIVRHLGPTLRASEMNATKILAVDDQRYAVPLWLAAMVAENASVLEYLDGVAVHWYADSLAPAALLDWTHSFYPDKFILATEACEGSKPWQRQKVALGSWTRAKNYILDIIQDLNHWVGGWIDWNLCLDTGGGPNWSGNYVDSPIIVNATAGEFYKQPMYYALAHLSKFVPRGSRRVRVEARGALALLGVPEHAAFLTPSGTLVLVLHNSCIVGLFPVACARSGSARSLQVRAGGSSLDLSLAADSIVTVELLAA